MIIDIGEYWVQEYNGFPGFESRVKGVISSSSRCSDSDKIWILSMGLPYRFWCVLTPNGSSFFLILSDAKKFVRSLGFYSVPNALLMYQKSLG